LEVYYAAANCKLLDTRRNKPVNVLRIIAA